MRASGKHLGYGRRAILKSAFMIPAFIGGASTAAAESAPGSCVNLESLSRSERNLRSANNFQARSDDPSKTCGACAFFTATQAGGCGACAIFSGGRVANFSRCDRWTKH